MHVVMQIPPTKPTKANGLLVRPQHEVRVPTTPRTRMNLQEQQSARSALYGLLLAGDASVATFDIVVLMVQDDAQAAAFRAEVERGVAAGQYPRQSQYRFVPDRPSKCGNGGAIIASLAALTAEFGDAALDSMKVLLLPCGGYSQRLPQYGPRGKIFAPVPFSLGPERPHPCTMLDLKLMGYLDIVPALPAGSCFVAWSDVLVFFDARGVDFSGEGFTVFGHEGSMAYGAAHAVMVLEPADASAAFGPGVARRSATYPCRHFFEKASPETLRRAGAVLPPSAEGGNEVVLVDSDFLFDRRTARLLVEFLEKHGPFKVGEDIDAGSDMQMACTQPFEQGPAAAATAAAAVAEQGTGEKLQQFLRAHSVGMHTAVLLPSTFYHIGTMPEYLQFYAAGIPELGGGAQVFNAVAPTAARRITACGLLHSILEEGAAVGAGAVVEYSRLGAGAAVGGGSIVSNTTIASGQRLPDNTFINTLATRPFDGGPECYVTQILNLKLDDVKCKDPATQNFCGVPIATAVARLGLSNSDVWADDAPHDLWNAALFPACGSAAESSAMALHLFQAAAGDAAATATLGSTLRDQPRYSMRGTFDVKCMSRDDDDRRMLQSDIAASVFYSAPSTPVPVGILWGGVVLAMSLWRRCT